MPVLFAAVTCGIWSKKSRSSPRSNAKADLPSSFDHCASHGVRALAVSLEEFSGHQARLTVPDRPVVDLSDRAQLTSGARDEGFVRRLEIGGHERFVANLYARILSNFEQEVARQPFQQAGVVCRCQRRAVTHHEEVRLRTFRQL